MLKNLHKQAFWEERYKTNQLTWDIGAATPFLIKFLKNEESLRNKKVCVLGCGMGHDVIEFARYDNEVYAIDFVEDAINHLNYIRDIKSYKIVPKLMNIFDLDKFYKSYFDVVYERNMNGGKAYQILWNNIENFTDYTDPESTKWLNYLLERDLYYSKEKRVPILFWYGVGTSKKYFFKYLISKGIKVTVIDNFSTGSESNLKSIRTKITLVNCDISDNSIDDYFHFEEEWGYSRHPG